MNDLHRRWFEPPSIEAAVSTMLRKFRSVPPAQLDHVRNERARMQTKSTMIAVGGAVVFLVLVIGVLAAFAPKKEGGEAKPVALTLLSVGLIAGAGVAVYVTCGGNNNKRAQRDEAFEELCRRHPGLRSARHTEFEDSSVGNVPWFHSEEWIHLYGLASGEYEGSPIVAVECTHVVDPILATTDSRVMQGLGGLVSAKQKRLFLRAMDATIFVEPLPNVSDLVFVPRMDLSRAYYKRTLAEQDCDLADVFHLPRVLRNKYWMAAADPEECGGLFATELPALLASRKWCIVQVVGGHCVVMTAQWHGNYPSRAPSTVDAVAENLEFARAVYQQLRQFSTAAADPSAAVPVATPVDFSTGTGSTAMDYSAEPAGVATAVAEPETSYPMPTGYSPNPVPVAQMAAVPKLAKRRRRRPHSLLAKLGLFGLGVPLFLVGVLATIGFSVDRQRGLAAGDWPQVDARIVESDVDVETRYRSGRQVMRFKPRVSYEYEVGGQRFTGDRVNYDLTSATMSKHEADEILARCPKDGVVKVHYLAQRPEVSVLEPGLRQESKMVCYTYVTAALMLTGLFMIGYGVIGKPVRPCA